MAQNRWEGEDRYSSMVVWLNPYLLVSDFLPKNVDALPLCHCTKPTINIAIKQVLWVLSHQSLLVRHLRTPTYIQMHSMQLNIMATAITKHNELNILYSQTGKKNNTRYKYISDISTVLLHLQHKGSSRHQLYFCKFGQNTSNQHAATMTKYADWQTENIETGYMLANQSLVGFHIAVLIPLAKYAEHPAKHRSV